MTDYSSFRDEELVVVIRDSNQELYRLIVERYETKLRRYAMTFLRDSDRAEDVLQNAFIKAYINLKGFNTKKKFSSWIYRIVHNEAVNELKKHKQETSMEDVPEIKNIRDNGEDIHSQVEKQEMADMLKKNLNQLSIKYREPLVLYYLEERAYEEISDILRLPIGTVGTRINRGKKLLRAIYERQTQANPS
ncbi:MAG: sigma-70 family RNA polymerase sigma factor [bacterium]